MSLGILSDDDLINVYEQAIHYQLERGFIQLINEEIYRRGLQVTLN